MAEIKFEDLLGSGAHFGHVTRKWNPNFSPYIVSEKNGVHIIDLESTIKAVNEAATYVKKIVSKDGEILFVGTKKQAQDIVQQEADRCSMFYIVERTLNIYLLPAGRYLVLVFLFLQKESLHFY